MPARMPSTSVGSSSRSAARPRRDGSPSNVGSGTAAERRAIELAPRKTARKERSDDESRATQEGSTEGEATTEGRTRAGRREPCRCGGPAGGSAGAEVECERAHYRADSPEDDAR